MSNKNVAYCFDTSAFINSWRRLYPIDVLPSLWDRIDYLIASDRIKAPEYVLMEIARVSDELHSWVQTRPQMFVPALAGIQTRVSHIINTYPAFLQERSPDGVWADPYVIALAQEQNRIVVTWETLADRNARRLKIPNICNALGVEWMNLLDLMRREAWTF